MSRLEGVCESKGYVRGKSVRPLRGKKRESVRVVWEEEGSIEAVWDKTEREREV